MSPSKEFQAFAMALGAGLTLAPVAASAKDDFNTAFIGERVEAELTRGRLTIDESRQNEGRLVIETQPPAQTKVSVAFSEFALPPSDFDKALEGLDQFQSRRDNRDGILTLDPVGKAHWAAEEGEFGAVQVGIDRMARGPGK